MFDITMNHLSYFKHQVVVLSLILFCCNSTSAQSCNIINLPDTIAACKAHSFILPATVTSSDSIISYLWTPSTNLSATSILNPMLNATTSAWYYLEIKSISPTNIVVNGDFSAGNIGFSSADTLETPSLSLPGHYTVLTDPSVFSAFSHIGDHTTGTGNMLLVDAAKIPGYAFWCEALSVIPNTDYLFTGWAALLYPPVPIVQVTVNGVNAGSFSTTLVKGQWVQYQTTFNSGPSATMNLCLIDLNTAGVGNDFVMDDISLHRLCDAKDSVYVSISTHDTLYKSVNDSACSSSGHITLNAPVGYGSYIWNTGSTAASISISNTGSYWVNATSGGCSLFVDSFYTYVKPSPVIYLASDALICVNQSINLSSPEPQGAQYQWSTGANTPFINVADPGLYRLTVTMDGCSTSDSTTVSKLHAPTVQLGSDTMVCSGNTFTLDVKSDFATYLWSDGSSAPNLQINETGTYWVTVSNICGTATDSINVEYDLCNIWFPSAFTPNGDGRNDILRVGGSLALYKDFSLSIFNRWGQRVFFTQNIYAGWNGVFNGAKQDLGTYFYYIYYTLEGKKSMMKGDVELIR